MRPRRTLLPLLILWLCSCGPAPLLAQTNEELLEALESTSDPREQYGILYELTHNYLTSSNFRDAATAAKFGERTHRTAQRIGDQQLVAAAAFVTARAYQRDRNPGKAETWYRLATDAGMKTGNVDLILKATAERTRIASRKQRYRDAVKINERALEYFTRDGNDISSLRARLEREQAALQRKRREVETATAGLADEVERLRDQKSSLENENQNLSDRNRSTNRELAARARELEAAADRRAEIEAQVADSKQEIQELSREALQQRALASEVQERLAEEALIRKEAELAAREAEMTAMEHSSQRNLALLVGGALAVLALLLLFAFWSRARAARKLSRANDALDEARQRSDELLENILPVHIASELKETGGARAQRFPEATVLFCDFVNFTAIAEQLGPEALVRELDVCFRAFDEIVDRYDDVEKIKTIGDAYMAASGLRDRKSVPNDIIRTALAMQEFLAEHGAARARRGLPYFTARIGLHTGPVVAGVVGARKFAYDIWGDTVNVAARVESNCAPGRVGVSESTYHLIKYRFACDYRGKVEAKNKGLLDLYYVERETAAAGVG